VKKCTRAEVGQLWMYEYEYAPSSRIQREFVLVIGVHVGIRGREVFFHDGTSAVEMFMSGYDNWHLLADRAITRRRMERWSYETRSNAARW